MFTKYEDYVHAQVVEGASHELDNTGWCEGQIKSIDDFLVPFLKPEDFILDAACGDGVGVKHLVDKGFKNVTGIDINPDKIARAKNYVSGAQLICSDITRIDLPDQSFNAIWSSHTLEHCNEPIKTLREFKRLLKPEGAIYIIVPYPADNHRIHCGCSELKLDVLDGAKSTLALLNNEGYTILDSKIIHIREPELFLKIK